MKKTFLVVTMLIGFSAFIFNSCSKSDSSTPAATTPPSPIGGVWSDSISTSAFYLALNNDYTYSFTRNVAAPYETGKYTLSNDTLITFLSSTPTTPSSCYGFHGVYIYKTDSVVTTVTTRRLTLALLSDSCATRKNLVIGKWLKK